MLNSLGAHTEGTMYQRLKARSRINQNAQPPTPRKYSVQYPIFFEIWDTQILLHGIYWAKHKINGVPTPNEHKCWDHSKQRSILRRRWRLTRRWSGWRGGTPWWQLTWAPIVSLITTSWLSQPPSPEQIAHPLHSGHQLRQQLLQLVVHLALPDKISSSLH